MLFLFVNFLFIIKYLKTIYNGSTKIWSSTIVLNMDNIRNLFHEQQISIRMIRFLKDHMTLNDAENSALQHIN